MAQTPTLISRTSPAMRTLWSTSCSSTWSLGSPMPPSLLHVRTPQRDVTTGTATGIDAGAVLDEDASMTTLDPPDGDEHLAAIVFDKPTRASEVLLNLIHLQQEGALRLADAVVIAKDEAGRARVQQTTDLTPGRGALIGGWL